MSLRLRLRSGLRQCGVGLMLRLPRPYPLILLPTPASQKRLAGDPGFAGLGIGLGYLLPRLTALLSSEG